MNLLIIDTTKKTAHIIAYVNNVVFNSVSLKDEKHSETVFTQIEKVLTEAKVELKDIDAYACVTGPGSFTGIRIGMTIVKSFYSVYNKPLISANVFEILSDYVKDGVVLLFSTHTSYYYGKISNSKVVDYGIINKDNLSGIINDDTPVFFLHDEQPDETFSYNKYETIKNYSYLLYQHFTNKAINSEFTGNENFEPFYIQLSQAEREILKQEE